MNDISVLKKDLEFRIVFDKSLDLPAKLSSRAKSDKHSYDIYITELKIPFKGLSAGNNVILKEISPNQELIYRKLTAVQNPYLEKILWVNENEHTCVSVNEFISRPEVPYLDYHSAGIQSRSLSLEQYVTHFGTLTEAEALIFAYHICEGLSAIRKVKLVHSDLAPQNILLTTNQNELSDFMKIPGIHQYISPKIIDFDITSEEKEAVHDVTTVMGTKPYAAPDILDYRCSNDKIDIYSLGCVIHFMLTGKSPKESTSEKTSISRIVRRIINLCTADYRSRYRNIPQIQTDILHALNIYAHSGFQRTISSYIPGFRSHKIWKMILASIYYFYFLMSSALFFLMGIIDSDPSIYFISGLYSLLSSYGVVFVIFDIFHWGDHCRPYVILRNKIPLIRIPVKIIAGMIFLCICSTLFSLI